MSSLAMEIVVLYDDGKEVTVKAGQRDLAKLEVHSRMAAHVALEERPMSSFRYVAYVALKRIGQVDGLAYEAWDDNVDSALPLDEDDDASNPMKSDQ
jgi:hypothetical protein